MLRDFLLASLCTLVITNEVYFDAEESYPYQAKVVGIVSLPSDDVACQPVNAPKSATSCFNFFYAQWLQQSGIEIAAIPYNLDADRLMPLLQSLNGILFTGGDLILNATTPYYMASLNIFKMVQKINNDGYHFPLWFTCQGFQMFSAMVANDTDVIEKGYVGVEGAMLPLNFTAAAFNSRMFSGAPGKIMDDLKNLDSTTNLHNFGVTPETYATTKLADFATVLSTNDDDRGVAFVSTAEAKDFPFYAVQWHPERPQFDHGLSREIYHQPAPIDVAQWASTFFASQVALSNFTFPSKKERDAALLYAYPSVNQGNGHLIFFFDN